MKKCIDCQQAKKLEEFYKTTRKGRLNYASKCKICHNTYVRNRRQPGDRKWSQINRLYKLSRDQYEKMLVENNNTCPICLTVNPDFWNVDHDHSCYPSKTTCGKCIRGLMCSKCNAGIGSLGDDPLNLLRAAAFLQGYKERTRPTF